MRIDHLPRNSAYVEAISLDEELAEQIAAAPPEKGPAMRMRDWSPQLEMLAVLTDRIGEVIQAVIAAQGGKPPRITPIPRPKTAADKLKDPRRQHHRILSKVMLTRPDGSVVPATEGSGPAALRLR